MKRSNFFKKGFSIGEVILSVFILSITLIVMIRAITNGLVYSIDNRNSIIASELAQEGVELVRNLRDKNWAEGRLSFDYPLFTNTSSDSCIIGYDLQSLTCSHNNNEFILKFDDSNISRPEPYCSYCYNHSNGTNTRFQRRIMVNLSGNEMTVCSLVTWDGSTPPTTINTCTAGNKCTYAQVVLNRWIEIL